MDREDCIEVILSALRNPRWRQSSSVNDWDLNRALQTAGVVLTPEQANALLAEISRRGLATGRERRTGEGRISVWGIRITPAGDDWLLQRAVARATSLSRPSPPSRAPSAPECEQPERAADPEQPLESGLRLD